MVLPKTHTQLSRITNNYLEYFFEELKFLLFPLYEYKQGNCHNLTHFASLILRSYGVQHKKIWIYAPTRYSENSKQTIQLPDPNQLSPNGLLTWGFHVALLLEYDGVELVFDFFIDSSKPLAVGEWLERMHAKKFFVDIVQPDYYLFYSTPSVTKKNGLFSGEYFLYEGLCREEKWIAKGLAINDTAVEFYKREWFNFKYNTPQTIDYKWLVGRVNNFECVLRDASINKKMTVEFQEKHASLIAEYREVYAQKLEKWTEKLGIYL